MIKEAIILAGGLGTRLREAVPDMPKCMAPVKGKPFIYYVIQHLKHQGIQHFIFALGYMQERFIDYLEQEAGKGAYSLSIEDSPLGTGGAIKKACGLVKDDSVIVANGDTLFKADLKHLSDRHLSLNADCTLTLKPMTRFDRYGVVELNDDYTIQSFQEKKYYSSGLINAGMYALNAGNFLREDFPEKFSFEKDYLERKFQDRKMIGDIQDVYFIDIGIPEDYERAQREL